MGPERGAFFYCSCVYLFWSVYVGVDAGFCKVGREGDTYIFAVRFTSMHYVSVDRPSCTVKN